LEFSFKTNMSLKEGDYLAFVNLKLKEGGW